MTLYITHKGRMTLSVLPLLSFSLQLDSSSSIFIKAGVYRYISVNPLGMVFDDGALMGFMGEYWTFERAIEEAKSHHMEIVGIITYNTF